MAATTGGHHVTTLFGAVFIIAPVIVLALLESFRTPLPDEPKVRPRYVSRKNMWPLVVRRLRRIAIPLLRTAIFGAGTGALLLLVVLPYWLWSSSDPITQVSIPHASRDNFLVNLNAGLVFWLIPYGLLLITIPYVIFKGITTKAWPLLASIGLLAFLGTGGTTPFPKMLLRGAFDILTLDRFTLWASILMLPLVGEFVVSLRRGGLWLWTREQFGRVTLVAIQSVLVVSLLLLAIFVSSLTQFRRFQPAPIDMSPIVNFLSKDEHWRWRFMTMGFGDQMAWLSAQTTATQVDGNYHSARRLPEMTTTPVERLEGAKYSGIPGIGSLQQFLAVPDKYNLKFIFSNDQFYDPLLFFYGWQRLGYLENGIAIWERSDIPVLPETLPRREIPLYQRLMFGILPPLALLAAIVTTTAALWVIPIKLFGEMTGLSSTGWRRPQPIKATVGKAWGRFDAWLRSASDLSNGVNEKPPRWQVRLRYFGRKWHRRLRPSSLRGRHVRVAVLACAILIVAAAGFFVWRARTDNPVGAVEAYFDDLDFRRFGAAYARLDPDTRPSYDQYLIDLSLKGGMVASYGKLDSLETKVEELSTDHARILATVTYITSLSYYTDTQTIDLTHTPAGWRIEPAATVAPITEQQLLRQPALDYLVTGGRRLLSPDAPIVNGLERPNVRILSSQLVASPDGSFSVVGELKNDDVNPADLTVRATIYDEQGEELTWYNAADGMIHKALPQETVPFRVDFEGVAGLALEDAGQSLSFSPGAEFVYHLPPGANVGSYDVYGKAITTQHDLERDVGVQDLVFTPQPDGSMLVTGELVNSGVGEAVIPHVFVTLYDADGRVRWVEHKYLRESVSPQGVLDFTMELPPSGSIQRFALPDPAASPGNQHNVARPDVIPLPEGSGYSAARVSVNYYTGAR
ncbi:MAG: hypothetical protein IPK16_10125 [Anaerolineales bacterium]|nr:hypothetical protein [Anaerolineales bacterium]